MRKVLTIVIVSVLLLASFAHVALADVKPAATYIPKPATIPAGFTFQNLWVELNPDEGGSGIELPQGGRNDFFVPNDDYIRGGVVDTLGYQHGLPIGFNFKFMQGPPHGIPVYGWAGPPGGQVWQVVDWNLTLDDAGFDEVYVALNGYVVFDVGPFDPGMRPAGEMAGLGTHAWWPHLLPSAEVPNCIIAPYWTDLNISDNAFTEVTSVHFVCNQLLPGVHPEPRTPNDCVNRLGYYAPYTTREVERPRGRLLYQTVGTAPNRKFVVEWANAKNIWTSNLATFELQLFEGSNGILYLYKEFTTKAAFEDPPHASPFLVTPSLIVGMEDAYGAVGVGQAYLAQKTPFKWQLVNPLNDLDMMAFHADQYPGIW